MLSLLPNNVIYPCLSIFIGDFGAQDFKIKALEVKDNDIPELRPRNRKVNFRPGKSTVVNRAHMVNPEVNPEGITQRLMQNFPTSTRRAHLIG